MQFLYPVFLVAGLSLLIPLIIHLFNLRRYKTVFFPHTRFLKNLQLHSKKQSEVRYKWLLAARTLFLAFLVLAFAQPFRASQQKENNGKVITALYIDNSQSMSLRNGQRSLLDVAKENALHLVRSGSGNFLVLSNDKPASYHPLSQAQALEAIQDIRLSAATKNSTRILTELQNMLQDDVADKADLYYLSDFQQNAFASHPDPALLKNVQFNGVQIPQSAPQNIYIDTAFFENPGLQTGQNNKLIVRTRYTGERPEQAPVLQLSVAGNVKSAASPLFGEAKDHYDTLSFQVNDASWQRILLTLNDRDVHFDDSFYIAARSSPELTVLLLNEGHPNPFIQAALRSYPGFRVTERPVRELPESLYTYNLVLLNGINTLHESLADSLVKVLQNGQNVAIFPGQELNPERVNAALGKIGDIRFGSRDTAAQTVSVVQSEHRLVKEMFEKVPENVQLPYTKNHYRISAGISANQQSIFSFRNGDPFFALYTPLNGQLYLCATPAEAQNGNFQSSYFFVPFLYQMASLAKNNSIYALTAGQKQAVFVNQPLNGRKLLHLKTAGMDAIPAQKAEGMGVQVFAGAIAAKAGFYTLSGDTGDSTLLGINLDRSESELNAWSLKQLRQNWNGPGIKWQEADAENKALTIKEQSAFPLWKLCLILALAMLGLETWLLSKNLVQQKVITV